MRQRIKAFIRRSAATLGFVLAVAVLLAELTLVAMVLG
jgi:hypothetical protein